MSFKQRLCGALLLLVVYAVIAFSLASCGNYGPLRLPENEAQQQGTGK